MKEVGQWKALEEVIKSLLPGDDFQKRVESFRVYLKELNKWNKAINLTSVSSLNNGVIRHILDSLSLYPLVKGDGKILDIGSGGGFPGIPLKILDPSLDMTLLEPRRKRWSFLNHIARLLIIKDMQILCIHSNEFTDLFMEYNGPFDIVVSRALASPPVFIDIAVPLISSKGSVICMVSENDALIFKEGMILSGLILKQKKIYRLPGIEQPRFLLVFKKNRYFYR